MKELANSIVHSKKSAIRKLFELVLTAKNAISFGIGQPDFPTPTNVLEAIKSACDKKMTMYAPAAGLPQLREVAAEKFRKENNISPEMKLLLFIGRVNKDKGFDILLKSFSVVKEKNKDEWDPFKMAKKTVKRDEFGYIISGKNKETTVFDTELNRQQVISAAEKLKKDTTPKEEKLVNFKKYKNAEEWYEENKAKRFRVINNFDGLSFVETGKVKAIQALKPPFVLQFGISQLKVMRQITLKQAIELAYDVYNKGLLKEV